MASAAPRAGRRAAGSSIPGSAELGPASFASPTGFMGTSHVPTPSAAPLHQHTAGMGFSEGSFASPPTGGGGGGLTSPTYVGMDTLLSGVEAVGSGGGAGAFPTPTGRPLSPPSSSAAAAGDGFLQLDGPLSNTSASSGVGRRGAPAAGRRGAETPQSALGGGGGNGSFAGSLLASPNTAPIVVPSNAGGLHSRSASVASAGRRGAAVEPSSATSKKGDDLDFLNDDDGGANASAAPSTATPTPYGNPTDSPAFVSLSSAVGGGGGRAGRSTMVSFIPGADGDPLGETLAPPSVGRRSGAVTPSETAAASGRRASGAGSATMSNGGDMDFLYEDDFVDETASVAKSDTTFVPTERGSQQQHRRNSSASPEGTESNARGGGGGAGDDDLDSLFGGGDSTNTAILKKGASGLPLSGSSIMLKGSSSSLRGGAGTAKTDPALSSAAYKALQEEVEALRAAAAKPKSLEEQQAELLAELHAVEDQLLKQTLKTNAAEHTYRREREGYAVLEGSKRVDLVRQQASVDAKIRETAAYGQKRLADIRSKGDAEVRELVASHTTMLQDRSDRILKDLEADIKLAHAEIDKLESQKELLLRNGSLEPPQPQGAAAAKPASPYASSAAVLKDQRAVYVKLLDAKSIDDKVTVALDMLMDLHNAMDEKMEKKVGHYIHLESSALIGETWEERHSTFVKESIARRDAFSAFKSELLNRATAFQKSRHDDRYTDVHVIQDLVKRNIEDVRERTIAVTARVEQECRAQFEELSAKFKSQYKQGIANKALQQKALAAEDERVYAAQLSELRSRHQMAHRLEEKLHAEEVETLHTLLARELERSAALKGTSAAVASSQLKEVGRRYQEAEDHSKMLAKMTAQITASIDKMVERNRAFKSTGVGASPAATAAVGAGGSGSPLFHNLHGLTQEEAHLVSLFAEKQAVLDGVHRAVKDQMDQLAASREGLGGLVESFEVKLTTLMREVHDARLSQQTQLSKAEAVRAQWEREHRAMLSHKNVQHTIGGSDGNGPWGPSSEQEVKDVYGLYPALGIALQLAATVRNAAVAQQEKYSTFCERRGLILQTQRQGDAAAAEDANGLQQLWERLLASVLRLNDGTKDLTERQVAVLSEQAKLGVERELLEHERRAMGLKAAQLDREAKEVGGEYHRLHQASTDVAAQSRQLEREQDAANRELRTLVVLQGDLRHQQAEHYAQANRLERMKQRLLGVWGTEAFNSGGGGSGGSGSSGYIDGSMLSNSTASTAAGYREVGNPYNYLNTTNTRYPRAGDENYYPPYPSSSTTTVVPTSGATTTATTSTPSIPPSASTTDNEAVRGMRGGGGALSSVSHNIRQPQGHAMPSKQHHVARPAAAAKGSMMMGAAADEESSDDDEEEHTDAYSEQQHNSRFHPATDESSLAYHHHHGDVSSRGNGGDTSAFTQLRHVSPSVNTSVAPSLDVSPAR